MCPPASPHKGAFVVKFPAHHACVFGMETPLHGRSGGHIGTAPTVSFGQIVRGRHPYIFRLGRLRVDVEWYFCVMNG